jgi:hypothetical protein
MPTISRYWIARRTAALAWLPFARTASIRYKRHVVFGSSGEKSNLRWQVLLPLALLLMVAAGACSRKIGDGCTTSLDCDPTGGTRTCDMSQPGGYCIIEGCDARSCPEDSVCMRVFPEPFLTSMCNPDPAVPIAENGCQADELCLPAGLCARRALEKRVCLQSCGGNGDCRGGYLCTQAGKASGSDGSIALTLNPTAKASFCSPDPALPPK